MGKSKRDKRHQNAMDIMAIGRDRTRPRSTIIEDEIGKQNRRATRRVNERKEIDEIMDEEIELLNNIHMEEWDE